MARIDFPLKNYQQQALDSLTAWLKRARELAKMGDENPAATAFTGLTGLPYRQAPLIDESTPYACLRIPTGGGKTLLAAHSISIAAREWMNSNTPMVLWLVPSDAILQQTLAALKDHNHPYRAALSERYGFSLSILDKSAALSLNFGDAIGNACVIVSTIQSFRREKENGKENPEGLKVYEQNGALMAHVRDLPENLKTNLFCYEGTNKPIPSLANVLRLHRPLLIIDEAHNARTPLSFDTLARFSPAMILELTATPQLVHEPNKDKYASNILFSVSAAALKSEAMIKMPIRLTTHKDWQKTIAAACDCQVALEQTAGAEARETGEYLRPIVLLQAQSASKNDNKRLTWEVLEKYLLEERAIPQEQIAVHTGSRHDLDEIKDIQSPDCPLRYIITVQKLKEGWDCPFAYILCSVAEQISPVAVEQLLGRVLRMPKAKRKQRDALNEAYAFVSADSFDTAAKKLRDGLVEGAGFDPLEVADMFKGNQSLPLNNPDEDHYFESPALPKEEFSNEEISQTLNQLPAALKSRAGFNEQSHSLSWQGPMSREHHYHLRAVFSRSKQAIKAIDQLYLTSNRIPQAIIRQEEEKRPFIVPLLGFRSSRQSSFILEPFAEQHFLNKIWRLDECDVSAIIRYFKPEDKGEMGTIDIKEKKIIQKHQHELTTLDWLKLYEPSWDLPRLFCFLDDRAHPDYTKSMAIVFITKALEHLQNNGFSFAELVRHRFELAHAVRDLINDLRNAHKNQAWQTLFAEDANLFAFSADLNLVFDEQRYKYSQVYSGSRPFNKHYFDIVGDLKSEGEEYDCACYLDRHPKIYRWIRNTVRSDNSFWLQLPTAKFYPDFVALLEDGRILVVEYKGGYLYDNPIEQQKRLIGEIWMQESGGQCLFCMPTERNFQIIDDLIR